jgi:hypothetical protein
MYGTRGTMHVLVLLHLLPCVLAAQVELLVLLCCICDPAFLVTVWLSRCCWLLYLPYDISAMCSFSYLFCWFGQVWLGGAAGWPWPTTLLAAANVHRTDSVSLAGALRSATSRLRWSLLLSSYYGLGPLRSSFGPHDACVWLVLGLHHDYSTSCWWFLGFIGDLLSLLLVILMTCSTECMWHVVTCPGY